MKMNECEMKEARKSGLKERRCHPTESRHPALIYNTRTPHSGYLGGGAWEGTCPSFWVLVPFQFLRWALVTQV